MADGGINETAVQCRAEAEDSAQLEAQERRCIFINTGPKTIAVHLQAVHTLVDHVRNQVAAQPGRASPRNINASCTRGSSCSKVISPWRTTA